MRNYLTNNIKLIFSVLIDDGGSKHILFYFILYAIQLIPTILIIVCPFAVPIEAFVVEKFDPETGIWIPCGKSKDPEMEVEGLVPGHEYSFRVKAVNKEGESIPLETLAPIIAKDPFSATEKPGTPEAVDWSANHVELVS